jgi:hypothetical protein
VSRLPFLAESPLKLIDALEQLPRRRGVLFPNGAGDEHLQARAPDADERADVDRTSAISHDAEEHDPGLQEAFDATDRGRGHVVGTENAENDEDESAAA